MRQWIEGVRTALVEAFTGDVKRLTSPKGRLKLIRLWDAKTMPLKQLIADAFAGVPYPGDDNLIRCPYNCTECQRIADYFRGKTFLGHAPEELRTYHVALALFTPEAFQYFLPAFMLASLDSYEKFDVLPDAIRFHFEYVLEYRTFFAVKMAQFSTAQKKAVIDYLLCMESKGAGSSEDVIGMLSEESEYA